MTNLNNVRVILSKTLIVLCTSILIALTSFAQSGSPLDELTLGLSQQSAILERFSKIEGTTDNLRAQLVFNSLLTTPTGLTGANVPYEITLIKTEGVNAFSTAAGKVYVTSGLIPILGEDLGVWAAVLSHEIAHTSRQHHYKSYLRSMELSYQIEYLRARAAAGDKAAAWALLGVSIAGGLGNMKLSRDDEHEADRVGLMMMAEAGFHPDFAITLHRQMRRTVGDQSKFAAFFSDHPRWATREQRTLKAYENAIARFNSYWSDPAKSPGGPPPPIATIGTIVASERKDLRAARVDISFAVRNAKERPIRVVALFLKQKKQVPAVLSGYQLKDGRLGLIKTLTPLAWNSSESISVVVPTAALGTKDRKLDVVIGILFDDEVLASSDPIKVRFPK